MKVHFQKLTHRLDGEKGQDMKRLIDTATGTTICEIVSNHGMTLDEAIYCAGGEIINNASDERYSDDGDNVIIEGKRYYYDDIELVY